MKNIALILMRLVVIIISVQNHDDTDNNDEVVSSTNEFNIILENDQKPQQPVNNPTENNDKAQDTKTTITESN